LPILRLIWGLSGLLKAHEGPPEDPKSISFTLYV
jgi:hypothetical protein